MRIDISIHLMLLFIYIQPSQGILLYKFQYISCYCLSLWLVTVVSFVRISIHLMLLFISLAKSDWSLFALFQYISCYCLSGLPNNNRIRNGFQYISCYCLSSARPDVPVSVQISIHLMLLFICSASMILIQKQYFNTSHVTVYPYAP